MYDHAFYDAQSRGSFLSAKAIVPEIVAILKPRSVVDFGCGVGTWLANFAAAGVPDITGIDGDHVPRDRLLIAETCFRSADLSRLVPLERQYDLAISLEVAEHLPEASAPQFIDTLTAAAPAVLFSAAVPGQGGTNHVNEQWQEYWRRLFRHRGYVAVDAIRPKVWGRGDVEWWYQQNILLYMRQGCAMPPGLSPVPETVSVDMVHLAFYRQSMVADLSFTRLVRALPGAFRRALAKRVGRSLRNREKEGGFAPF